MRKFSLTLVILLFGAIFLSSKNPAKASSDFTQGRLDVFTKKGKPLGQSPLKHTTVNADISGFLARVNVRQEFQNNFKKPIEAVYTFPLSQNSAVDRMTMKIGSRTILGKIKPRDEARKLYETAKAEGKTASLLDQERANVFTQSVANILPGETIVIEISYVETLKYRDGSYEFVFPMVVGPRYSPKSYNRKKAARVTPPVSKTRAGQDISIELNLDAGVPIENISSKLHEITTQKLTSSSAAISLKNANTIPNRDFILRYDVTGKRIEDAVLTHADRRGGFFTMMLSPPQAFEIKDVRPKEIVFVLDTSGSMSGFPIEKAKEAMKMSLKGLYPNDKFNLITFAGNTEVLFDKPVFATHANLERALAFLESRKGSGGTEMMKAVKAAFKDSDSGEYIRIVNFMTDGYISNESQIIAEIQKHPNARVFSFGIGDSVNRFLLDKMAAEGRGEVEYVTLKDDGTSAAKRFYERIRNPLLTDISIDWNGLPVADIYPKRNPDLFDAKPVVINGRYTKAAKGAVKLKGKIAGRDYERKIQIDFPKTEEKHDVLASIWARQRIDDLMSQNYDFEDEEGSEGSETVKTITRLGLAYGLMTQFTSFVAVEEVIRNENGRLVRVEVPVDLAHGTFGEDEDDKNYKGGIGQVANRPAGVTKLTITTRKIGDVKSGRGSGQGGGFGTGSGSGIGNGNASTRPTPALKAKPKPSGLTRPLKILSKPRPGYTKKASQLNIEGTVILRVTFLSTGKIGAVIPIKSLPHGLTERAIAAARKIRFTPPLRNGQPYSVTKRVQFNFTNYGSWTEGDESSEQKPKQNDSRMKRRSEKFHFWIFDLYKRRQNGNTNLNENDELFLSGSSAHVQILLREKSTTVLQKLIKIGFESSGEHDKKVIFGKIAISKLEQIAEIDEVEYILPKIK